jgi:23S rRNA pseudouridine2605 synthase
MGKPIKNEKKVYYIFDKPRAVVYYDGRSTRKTKRGGFFSNLTESVSPVGRLDYNTEGLLLLTNDGSGG